VSITRRGAAKLPSMALSVAIELTQEVGAKRGDHVAWRDISVYGAWRI
jgi:hypothetical protein